MFKKGIRGHDIAVDNLTDLSAECKKHGIEYLQLALDKTVSGFKYGMYSDEYAKQLKCELGDTKIGILGSYINLSNPNEAEMKSELDRFKEKIKYASILKPVAVGTETGIYKSGETHTEEAYQYVLKNVLELVEYAKKYDVCVAVEGVWCFVIDSPKKLARLISDVNSDNFKVIFDPVNYLNLENYKMQDEIISEAFELFADKIAAIHIKDLLIDGSEMKRVCAGEGILNFKLLFEKMREYNVDVPLIHEETTFEDAKRGINNLEKIY